MYAKLLAVFVLSICIFAENRSANAQGAATGTVDPMLEALERLRPVMRVVREYYPSSSYLAFDKRLHFEDSTKLYVAEAIVKTPIGVNPPLVVVRGPREEGGFWCDVVLERGSSESRPRAEGATEREDFTEHLLYQDLPGTDHYLQMILRVTKGDDNEEFVEAVKSHVRSYGKAVATDN